MKSISSPPPAVVKGPPVSVVLVVHNEAGVIEQVVRGFHEEITSRLPGSEILVAEDGSADGTAEILQGLTAHIPELRLEQGRERRGYVKAFKTAMSLARHELILFCDASGKHDPADFWPMYSQIAGCDMIVGYKVRRQDPLYRIVIAKVFNRLVNAYFGVSFRDIDCPFRLIRKPAFKAVAAVPWKQKGLINFEITVRMVGMGYRVEEAPVKHLRRRFGTSRGLPLKTIPGVVLATLGNFAEIRRSAFSRDGQPSTSGTERTR